MIWELDKDSTSNKIEKWIENFADSRSDKNDKWIENLSRHSRSDENVKLFENRLQSKINHKWIENVINLADSIPESGKIDWEIFIKLKILLCKVYNAFPFSCEGNAIICTNNFGWN